MNKPLPRVRRRFLHPIWLLASLPGYIGLRLLPALNWGVVGTSFAVATLVFACALIPISVGVHPVKNRRIADALAWAGLLSMGFFSTLFVMTLLRDVVLMSAHLVLRSADATALTTPTATWALALTFFGTLVGLFSARLPRLVDVEIPIADLPRALHGFTIAQISDLHVGPTIKQGFVERIVARVNALKADVIAVTGDLVDGSVRELSRHTAPLGTLTARHGVFFVTGNHEYYSGEPAWTAELRRIGLKVLKNQHVTLHHDGAALVLAGVTDYSAHHFDPGQRSDPVLALAGASTLGPKVLLAHQPSTAAAAEAAGYDLQLSGHTHGGQFWPWNWLVGYFQPYTRGLNRLKNLQIYVSRGTGYWGPPNRFGVPAEITRLRLIPA